MSSAGELTHTQSLWKSKLWTWSHLLLLPSGSTLKSQVSVSDLFSLSCDCQASYQFNVSVYWVQTEDSNICFYTWISSYLMSLCSYMNLMFLLYFHVWMNLSQVALDKSTLIKCNVPSRHCDVSKCLNIFWSRCTQTFSLCGTKLKHTFGTGTKTTDEICSMIRVH